MSVIEIYTDGSTGPKNPGPSGYGFHGKIGETIIVDGWGGLDMSSTNQAAELTAIHMALLTVLNNHAKYKFTTVVIHSDSKYGVNGIRYSKKWKANGWVKGDGAVPSNLSIWKSIHVVLDKLAKVKLIPSFKWVKGHSGVAGNEAADVNANKGRLLVMAKDESHHVEYSNVTELLVVDDSPVVAKTRKTKVVRPSLPPMICGKRWFFLTHTPQLTDSGKHCYFTGSYVDKKGDNDKYAGKQASDSFYNVVLMQEPVPVLREIVNKYDASVSGKEPVIVNMTQVTKRTMWDKLIDTASKYLEVKDCLLVDTVGGLFGKVARPALQLFQMSEAFDSGLALLEKYHSNHRSVKIIDITDYVLVKNGKGLPAIAPGFTTGTKSIKLSNIELDGTKINLVLSTGIDIPNRLVFTRLVKEKNPIKVSLICWDTNRRSYRCATVIESNGNSSINFNPFSNYRLKSK